MLYRNLILAWTQLTEIWLRCSAQKDLNTLISNNYPLTVVCLIWPWASSLRLQEYRYLIKQLKGKPFTYCTYFFFSTNIRMCCSSNDCASLCTWKHHESADYLFVPSEEAVELEHQKPAESETATSVPWDTWQNCTWHQFWCLMKVIYPYGKYLTPHFA